MKKNTYSFFFLVFSLFLIPLFGEGEGKHVFLSLLVRNKAHLLPTFFRSIENLEYNKKNITVYINTNNNSDATEAVLTEWVMKQESFYRKIIFESHEVKELSYLSPHEWTTDRLKALALIRNKSLKIALENKSDYYFIVDCDNFLIPATLADLVAKDLPIVAPMLRSIPDDRSTNFFAAVSANGYYAHSPEYYEISKREKIGTFKVPLVHCTYLIKRKFLDKLSYTDETNDYEFIIFSRIARNNKINQYICNEKIYGYNLNFFGKPTLEQEKDLFASVLPSITTLIEPPKAKISEPALG